MQKELELWKFLKKNKPIKCYITHPAYRLKYDEF